MVRSTHFGVALAAGFSAARGAGVGTRSPTLRGANFFQIHAKRLPTDDEDGPEFEYGDKEFHARDADSSDYSIHQFLVADDGRDGPKSADEEDQGFAMRRAQALAREDHFNSEETPSTDTFVQVASSRKTLRKLPTDDEDGPEFEYGDKEFHARDADSSDYSIHQFLVADDGRDGPKSADEEDQGFAMRRAQALAKEDHFNSEETPSTDTFVQVTSSHTARRHGRKLPTDDDDGPEFEYGDKEFHARDADSSDYSIHQFLVADDGRDGPKSADEEDQGFAMRRAQALAKEDHFNSEETPSTDTFLQLESARKAARKLPLDDEDGPEFEYGDKEFHARDADSSDYSIHQFLVADDGRDGPKSADEEDQGFAMRRAQALAKEDHFNSEETPSTDTFVQIASSRKSSRRLPTDDEDGPEFEYGDKEFHARDADSSDYSIHQFLVADDGRDGPKSADEEDQGFAMRRAQALAKEDHFNSEETPSTDTFVQLASSRKSARKLPIDDEDGPEFEYGDKEFHARDADSSDYSIHQFLVADDGRDGPKSADEEDQGFAMRRAQALAKEDHFNSEETPSTDN